MFHGGWNFVGGVDTAGNAVVLEVWGKKGDSWMQGEARITCDNHLLLLLLMMMVMMMALRQGRKDYLADWILFSYMACLVVAALHAFFGVGSIVSPVVVGSLGYTICFTMFASLSFLPLMGVSLEDKVIYRLAGGGASAMDVSVTTRDEIPHLDGSVQEVGESEGAEVSLAPMPLHVRLLMCTFLFIYVGVEVRQNLYYCCLSNRS